MTPPKAKLHSKTGRLKNINKTYTSGTNSSDSINRTSASRTTLQTNETNQNAMANQRVATTTATTEPSTSNNIRDTAATEQFELELCWCIQTLEKSIESGKLNDKQGEHQFVCIFFFLNSNYSFENEFWKIFSSGNRKNYTFIEKFKSTNG